MQLFHVSERADIRVFEPRIPSTAAPGIRGAVVWAIERERLGHYLVPRDCPRVCFRAGSGTSENDRARFLGSDPGLRVVAIEPRWLRPALENPLWVYELPPASFASADRIAGYFVSRESIQPLSSRRLDRPLTELLSSGYELQVVSGLHELAGAVASSSLEFSCIRMRNAMASARTCMRVPSRVFHDPGVDRPREPA